ncbi:MAG: transglutaminase-like cysteine peptidase, partial [Proteobacteria bacterium]|nr:transglutaminase-like cysteine peptidase [Pseudomonadota bacterium]MBU1454081.1 transglutaminase-like cysteine peptidase [Pseudomonadota bacterium]
MALLLAVLVNGCSKKPLPPPEPPVIERYDEATRKRIAQWKALIKETKKAPISEKLASVNKFFNHLHFVTDRNHWGQEDYWATPLETLVSNGGDCEDFTIAKYFTLKSLEVPDKKMRLTYVKSLTRNQAHMVLNYYHHPSSDPLVL